MNEIYNLYETIGMLTGFWLVTAGVALYFIHALKKEVEFHNKTRDELLKAIEEVGNCRGILSVSSEINNRLDAENRRLKGQA